MSVVTCAKPSSDRDSDSLPKTSTSLASVHFDLRFLLVCDAISRDFLLPHFSFHDLLALERTCKPIRDVIRQKRWWKVKVEEFRAADRKAAELLSRYSSAMSLEHPDYHRKMISKYLKDSSNVMANLKSASCRKCTKAFRFVIS